MITFARINVFFIFLFYMQKYLHCCFLKCLLILLQHVNMYINLTFEYICID